MRNWTVIILALILSLLLLQGCSEIEPKTGTKVTFAFAGNQPLERSKLADLSRYLMIRGQAVLDVPRPRVDKVTDYSLVLLLPGKKIARKDVDKLTAISSIELYHLSNVATDKYPKRSWKIKAPSKRNGPYLFQGPDAKLIDSQQDMKALLTDVVDSPHNKPILTGRDVLPTAVAQQAGGGWAVLIQFNDEGAKTFYDFTKNNPGEYLAVFYNGRLLSAPLIKDGISGGKAFITGFTTQDEAHSAAASLNAGFLPAKVRIERVEYY